MNDFSTLVGSYGTSLIPSRDFLLSLFGFHKLTRMPFSGVELREEKRFLRQGQWWHWKEKGNNSGVGIVVCQETK
jgi:hypothetical protein